MSIPVPPYRLLPDEDRGRLRLERIAQLEADHYRGMLRLEDARSDPERESLAAGLQEIVDRLAVHYDAIGPTVETEPSSSTGATGQQAE